MSSNEQDDFDTLLGEFRNAAGPLEMLTGFVQEGIEVEAFSRTPAGKILVGTALQRAQAAVQELLRPSATTDQIVRAATELRVQHGVLRSMADAVRIGKDATRRIVSQESEESDE